MSRPRAARVVELGLLAIVAGALAAYLAITISRVTNFPGPFVDWRTYENAFSRLTSDRSIYAPMQTSGPYRLTDMLLIGYAYPPASVPLFGAFQGYPFGLWAWFTVNLGLLFTALWTMCTRYFGERRIIALAIVMVCLFVYDPFVSGVVAANVNLGLAGLVGWVALGLGPRVAGVAGGVGAVVKVFAGGSTLAVADGKFRAVTISAVLALASIALTLPLVGVGAWIDFARALRLSTPDCASGNLSIACTLGPMVGLSVASVIGLIIGVAAAAALLVVRKPMAMATLLTIVIMAPAYNLHQHYWLLPFVLLVAAVGNTVSLRAEGHQTLEGRAVP